MPTKTDRLPIDIAIEEAIEARDDAYAPYSEYSVGASVIVESTDPEYTYEFYTGCNIENGNYSNTTHAEELAIDRAVKDGHREILALVVATQDGDHSEPCGRCQQDLMEFGSVDTPVIVQETGTEYTETTLADCTPFNLE